MKRFCVFMMVVAGLLCLAACGGLDKKGLQDKIKSEEQALSMIDIASEDEKAHDVVSLYLQYAEAFPSDTLTPVYLFKAAEVSANLGDIDEAIGCLDRITEDYSEYDDLGMCYFLKGHVYEMGERYDDALVAYEEYLALFPDHYLAESVRTMLPYIGMTADQMLEMVLKQANDNNLVSEREAAKSKKPASGAKPNPAKAPTSK